ncbi:MAG: Hsp33 family molecular chaperone HslO [Clostridia bacterium]|nr:Hsp33 family molecular chaperone HslO [Clostridia bacterium]MBR4261070.1 Hsp33 family molecular chaperone HslO [Clostridia bacterium]
MKEDKIIRCLAHNGKVNVRCIRSTNMVEEARKLHDLSPTATAALGRLLTITSLLGKEMKDEKGTITTQVKGNGPIGSMTAVADNNGNVKGYVINPQLDLPLNPTNGKLNVGEAVGREGMIYIIKDIGLKEPYVGMTPIVSGEIAEDFTNYFATSEQTPTVVALGVLVDKNGVRAAGGYLITLMPDAGEEEITKIEEALKKADNISKMLDDDKELVEIAEAVTGDMNLMYFEDDIIPEYRCNCSRDKMENNLISIGKDDINDIIAKDGQAELVCHFCNKKYLFTEEDLRKLID